jgi:hypothetical protein
MIPTNSVDHSRSPERRGMRPAHCMALTSSSAALSRQHALHAHTCAADLLLCFCSARPLGCVSAAQCRSERPTALLLLALEDS